MNTTVDDLDEDKEVSVQKDYACPACQRINDRENKKMTLKSFNQLSIQSQETAWKEEVSGKIIYRIYIESNHYRCRGGC